MIALRIIRYGLMSAGLLIAGLLLVAAAVVNIRRS